MARDRKGPEDVKSNKIYCVSIRITVYCDVWRNEILGSVVPSPASERHEPQNFERKPEKI